MVKTLLAPARARRHRLATLVGGRPTPAQWIRIGVAGLILLGSLVAWHFLSLAYPGG